MKRAITLGIAISIVMVSLFAACAAPETTPTPEPAETPDELLDRASGIASVTYDQVMTIPGEEESMQMKVWVKGNKMRMEMTAEGETGVILVDRDAQVGYMLPPSQDVAIKMDLGPQAVMPYFSLLATTSTIEWAKLILASPEAVVVDSETVDGKECLMIEVVSEGLTTKAWVWKDYGLLIRLEMQMPVAPGMPTPETGMILEYKNFEFVSIPDDMFELPSGVQIQEQ